jgi:hypothetical protein
MMHQGCAKGKKTPIRIEILTRSEAPIIDANRKLEGRTRR